MDNDLAAEALATITKLQRKIERMEKAAAKRDGGLPLGLPFRPADTRQIGPPRVGIDRPGTYVVVGADPPEPVGKGRGDDETGPLGLTRRQIQNIDKAEAAKRQRVAKGTKTVRSIGEGLAQGKRMKGS